jgi:hypothetical protein
MATGGRRDEIDSRIKGWEHELERLRLALANAPEAVHEAGYPRLVELYRRKEMLRSRWERIRGVYRPGPTEVQAFEEALAAMESAWRDAEPLLSEARAAGAS